MRALHSGQLEPKHGQDSATTTQQVWRPLLLNHDWAESAMASVRRIVRLVENLPQIIGVSNYEDYLSRIMVPEHLWDLVGKPSGRSLYMRPDCMIQDNRIQILELNIGTGTLNISGPIMANHHVQNSAQFDEIRRGTPLMRQWEGTAAFAKILQRLSLNGNVGLWYHATDPKAVARAHDMADLMNDYLYAESVTVKPLHTKEALNSNLPLFPYFSMVHLIGDGDGLLTQTIRTMIKNDVMGLLRPGDLIYESKANLALLFEAAERGCLRREDTEAVLESIPPTYLLPSTQSSDQCSKVIKPIYGFRSEGVVIRGEHLLDQADDRSANGGLIAQRRVELSNDLMDVFGSELKGFVLSPHILNGAMVGWSARGSFDSPIISASSSYPVLHIACFEV